MSHLEDLSTYEEIPYPPTLSYSQTHPDRLATIATLLGLTPVPVNRCRVLELGCANGGNLMPMAQELPGSQFVGVDYAANQIDAGQQVIDALGLQNIRLENRDILQIDADFGQFDYIIVHGVYSWVPEPVREKILDICNHNLAPNGVAYVSYNAFPGWHMLLAARDMMLYHTRNAPNAKTQTEEATQLLEFMADYLLTSDSIPYSTLIPPYAGLLKHHWERVKGSDPSLLLHDELSTVNQPFYFHQFAEAAARHGLQYLSEVNFPLVMPANVNPKGAEMIEKAATNLIEMEQYMDFLRNRTFRQTLLCHDNIEIQRAIRPDPARMAAFSFASKAKPDETEIDINSAEPVQFTATDKSVLTINHPLSKAALLYLSEVWPQIVPFDKLLAVAREQVYADGAAASAANTEQDALILTAYLLQGFTYSIKLIEIHSHTPQFVRKVSARPTASPLARHYAAQGYDPVANARHERIGLDPFTRHMLPWLDGQHDLQALVDIFSQLVSEGTIHVEDDDGTPVTDATTTRTILAEELDKRLETLARAGLLIA